MNTQQSSRHTGVPSNPSRTQTVCCLQWTTESTSTSAVLHRLHSRFTPSAERQPVPHPDHLRFVALATVPNIVAAYRETALFTLSGPLWSLFLERLMSLSLFEQMNSFTVFKWMLHERTLPSPSIKDVLSTYVQATGLFRVEITLLRLL